MIDVILIIHHYLALFVIFLLVNVFSYTLYSIICPFNSYFKINILLSKIYIYILHIQAFLGFFLLGNIIYNIINKSIETNNIINDYYLRYKLIEHPIIMLIILVTSTYSHIKLKKEGANYMTLFLFFISFIISLVRLPFFKF